ncbi:hypothetical protein H920_12782 [Fukomys damarensis]|uniref:Uncharacterized protein n=1 Tax=Fukomys damarensis TaxID=885580 RepID=A0A091D183_FUKDA|nr:hypothetical protein H920_12782 [Fukomys damarensis]
MRKKKEGEGGGGEEKEKKEEEKEKEEEEEGEEGEFEGLVHRGFDDFLQHPFHLPCRPQGQARADFNPSFSNKMCPAQTSQENSIFLCTLIGLINPALSLSVRGIPVVLGIGSGVAN